ncbi:MAG: DUF4198 domain-containing protein [Dethiobacter sp.]|jgi:uncharacterized GH25 family protein|nr:MAG: DUF4198 domain-containing protein [Dethiobacter sp.]
MLKGRKIVPFRDTTHLMVEGHEGWLDISKNVYDIGEKVKAKFKWGHNMKADGLCSSEGLSAWITRPSGEKAAQNLIPGEGLYYETSFLSKEIGFYEILVQKEGMYSITRDGKYLAGSRKENPEADQAIAYTQYAWCPAQVGSTIRDIPACTGCNLCVLQLNHYDYQVGQDLHIKILFKAEPLPEAEVTIARMGADGYFSETKRTDSQGALIITPDSAGQHILIARYVDEKDKLEGEYDKRSYTSVFTFVVN